MVRTAFKRELADKTHQGLLILVEAGGSSLWAWVGAKELVFLAGSRWSFGLVKQPFPSCPCRIQCGLFWLSSLQSKQIFGHYMCSRKHSYMDRQRVGVFNLARGGHLVWSNNQFFSIFATFNMACFGSGHYSTVHYVLYSLQKSLVINFESS